MNEEPLEGLVSGREPVEEDVGPSKEKESSEAQNTSEAAPSDSLDIKENTSSAVVEETPGEAKEQPKATGGEPPVDWFEPLEEDDDANSGGRNDPEEESLAGESERSESSEKAFKKIYQ